MMNNKNLLIIIFSINIFFVLFPSQKNEKKIPENITQFIVNLNDKLPENLGSVVQDAYINIGKEMVAGKTRQQGINKFFNSYLENQQEHNEKSIFTMKEIISSIAFRNKEIKQYYQKLFCSIIMYDFIQVYKKNSSNEALQLLSKLFCDNGDEKESLSVDHLYIKSYEMIFKDKRINNDSFDVRFATIFLILIIT